MDKHKDTESLIHQLISSISADAKLLTEKIASNQLKPQEIGEKITTLFKKAQSELQQIETPKPQLTLKTRLTAHVRPDKLKGV